MIRLTSTIERLEKHIKTVKTLRNSSLENPVYFDALAMNCFQAINAALDLGDLIVSEKNLGFAERYRELFELLFEAKIIDKPLLEKMKRLIFLRNLIAHEYYVIKAEELKELALLIDSLTKLIEIAKKAIKS